MKEKGEDKGARVLDVLMSKRGLLSSRSGKSSFLVSTALFNLQDATAVSVSSWRQEKCQDVDH